jgi:hypothetical protein
MARAAKWVVVKDCTIALVTLTGCASAPPPEPLGETTHAVEASPAPPSAPVGDRSTRLPGRWPIRPGSMISQLRPRRWPSRPGSMTSRTLALALGLTLGLNLGLPMAAMTATTSAANRTSEKGGSAAAHTIRRGTFGMIRTGTSSMTLTQGGTRTTAVVATVVRSTEMAPTI